MSQTKTERVKKRQLGQFYTPPGLARRLVEELPLTPDSAVLEPSAGNGSFVLPLLDRFMAMHSGTQSERLRKALRQNIFAVEIDEAAHAALLAAIERQWGPMPTPHHLVQGDFFKTDFHDPACTDSLFGGTRAFDWIVGNPPFGGTIDPRIQDQLDGRYGERDGLKIKKET